jgi:hypothetical protein
MPIPVARVPAGLCIVMPAATAGYARALYANLRQLDAAGADVILVETPPDSPPWAAEMDRLRRAATPAEAKPKRKRESAAGAGQEVAPEAAAPQEAAPSE